MTKNLERRKYKLIQEIIRMDDEASIAKIEGQIEAMQKEDTVWHAAIKPMRKTITLYMTRSGLGKFPNHFASV